MTWSPELIIHKLTNLHCWEWFLIDWSMCHVWVRTVSQRIWILPLKESTRYANCSLQGKANTHFLEKEERHNRVRLCGERAMQAIFLISGMMKTISPEQWKTQTDNLIPSSASRAKHWSGCRDRVNSMPRSWCQICWNRLHFQLWSTLPELELHRAAETHGHGRWIAQLLSESPQRYSWCVVLHHKLLRTMGVL